VTDTALAPIEKLTRDVRNAAVDLDPEQTRFIVDLYYQTQEMRKRLRNQERALHENDEPTALVNHFAEQIHTLEKQIPPVMNRWTDSFEVGRWAKRQKGVGPVLAAGLLAHIDVTRAPRASSVWRYCGLDPSVEWNKGQKRPWNATLKTLSWRIGESFVRQSGSEDCFYGQIYRDRKAKEVERDNSGANAEEAQCTLATRNIQAQHTRAYYEAGHLPPGRLDLRARRYAVKLFLSHYWTVAYREEYGVEPPMPYAIEHLGHAHYIAPPE
jgi:hypothetical protein